MPGPARGRVPTVRPRRCSLGRPAGGPWRPSAAWRLVGAAGTLLPAPPVRNPRPRPCRCPRRRRYRTPGAGARVRSPQRWRRGCTNFGSPRAGRRPVCVRGSAGPGRRDAGTTSRRAGPGAGPGAGLAGRSRFGGNERIRVGVGVPGPAPSAEHSWSAGPCRERRLSGLRVRASSGARAAGSGDVGGGGSGTPDAFGAHPGASAQVSRAPRRSGRAHSCALVCRVVGGARARAFPNAHGARPLPSSAAW